MFEYDALSKSQLSSTLAANLTSTQHLPEVFFDLSRAAQTVEFSPDDQTLSNKRIQWQTSDESRGLRQIIGFDIEKRHWGRYLIMRKKSCQHQHYGMGRTGSMKYTRMKRAKDRTSEYGHLSTFLERVASVAT